MNKYILTGIVRGTEIGSPKTINSEIVTEDEFRKQYSCFGDETGDGRGSKFFDDMIGQAKAKGQTYWLYDDGKYIFMLKKI